MGSFKLKRLGIPQTFIDILEKQHLYSCKETLSLTTVELQYLLGISYKEALKLLAIISKKCVSEPQSVYEIHVNQRKSNRDNFFPSSLYDLDMLLQGGLLVGSITEIAGPPGVGKTQFCLMLSLLATLPSSMGGLNSQVIFIDTESAFSASRLRKMAKSRYPVFFQSESDMQNLLERIIVHKATSVFDLKEIISNIEQSIIKEKVKLVIIDSIASLFRKEYGASDLQSIIERNDILLEQASMLKSIAETYGIVVFLTNQITSHSVQCDPTVSEYLPGENEDNDCDDEASTEILCQPKSKKSELHEKINLEHVMPALGTAWSHCVNTRLAAQFLDSEVRQLLIAKSPVAPNAAVRYILNESGVVLTGDDIEFLNVYNTEHQNLFTKHNFLTDKITGPGIISSARKRMKLQKFSSS